MNIAYINKTQLMANMPSTVFSTLNAYAIAENGHDVTLIFKEPKNNKTKEFDFKAIFEMPALNNFRTIALSDRFLFIKSNESFYRNVVNWFKSSKRKWDVVITRDPGCLPYLLELRDILHCKIFYQSHNFYIDPELQPDQNKINKRKFQKNEIEYIPKLDGLLTITEAQKTLYDKYVATPIFVSKPGVGEIYKPKDNFSWKIIMYSGSFQKKKGIETLISAFSRLRVGGAKLLLAGGRNKREIKHVKNIVRAKDLVDYVVVTGWLNYAELKRHAQDATVGAAPLADTFYNRNLTAPSKIFDYFACGVPVVASDLPAVRELVDDGKNGLLVPADDESALTNAIEKILTEKSLYAKLSRGSHKTARASLWKDRAKEMIDFIIGV